MPQWDLEYLLLFGPPENKLELLRGTTPCSFPFRDRAEADAHFAAWSQTLARWQGVSDPPVEPIHGADGKRLGRFTLKQYRRPIRLDVPSEINAYHRASECFFDRSLWPDQPQGFEAGFESPQRHWRAKLNLWNLFREADLDGGGIGGVDISLTDRDGLQPDHVYYPGPRDDHTIGGQYYRGVPLLVMEVLSPFSRAIDRGPRKERYRRAGVPQLWLLEPLTSTVELHQLVGGEYQLTHSATSGQSIRVPGLDPFELPVDAIFDADDDWPTAGRGDREPSDGWSIPPDVTVGLQHLILLGHAERRREIWDDRAPCFLAFGSAEEARLRLDRFVLEAARWEDRPAVPVRPVEPDVDVATVGRFHFARHRHVVRLDVAVDGRLYRALLDATADRAAWDWGDADD